MNPLFDTQHHEVSTLDTARGFRTYLIGFTVPQHTEFAVGHNLHAVTLYRGRIEILVRHHVLRVSRAWGVRGYLTDLVNDLLAGGVHVPTDQAIIAWCNARRAAWSFRRSLLLTIRHCRAHHRSRSHFPEKRKRSRILISP